MSDKLQTLEQWLADVRQLCQDEHVIADHAIPHLERYIAHQRRAAAQDMRERCALHLEAFAAHYPADIFPSASRERGAIAGTALRYFLPTLAEELRALGTDFDITLDTSQALPLEAKGKDDAARMDA